MQTLRYILYGRVQGVGFRHFAVRMADLFDIAGWVRNLDTGALEVVAAGTVANLAAFKEQLELGPGSARVDRVETTDLDTQPPAGFVVKR